MKKGATTRLLNLHHLYLYAACKCAAIYFSLLAKTACENLQNLFSINLKFAFILLDITYFSHLAIQHMCLYVKANRKKVANIFGVLLKSYRRMQSRRTSAL
jgi:hypothetical protein